MSSQIISAPAIKDISRAANPVIDGGEVLRGECHNLTASLDRAEGSFSHARTHETSVMVCFRRVAFAQNDSHLHER